MGLSRWTALCAAGAIVWAGNAGAADFFTLHATNNGDGGVTLLADGFDLYGADNGFAKIFAGYFPLSSLTTYTATAGADETVDFDWTYTTFDLGGAQFDPGGYIVNGVQHQLSPPFSDPINFDGVSGYLSLDLKAGDTYGFYIYTGDSEEGRGHITVFNSDGPSVGAFDVVADPVPEPEPWALMIAGFFGLGAVIRRRKFTVA
jgi:hypothetical protein